MMSSFRRVVPYLVALSLITSACGRGNNNDLLAIGVKRVALDLTFAKEELKQPIEPRVIINLLPPIEGLNEPRDLSKFATPRPFSSILFPRCPVAPEGKGPLKPVTFAALLPPAVGSYPRHNKGTIKITGAIPLTFPYPPTSTRQIPKTERFEVPPAVGTGDPTVTHEWRERKILAPGFEQIDSLRLLKDRIELVKRTTINQGVSQDFTPSPPLQIYTFGDEGSVIASAAVDTATNTSMAIQGTVEKRENVDVCGEVIDTGRISLNETMVNLDTGETSGTPQDDPNIYNYANQYGGLVVREDFHYTQTTKAPDGTPIVFEFEYVSTLNSVVPQKIES